MGSLTSCESLLDADLGAAPTSGAAGGGVAAGGATERVAIVGSGNWGSAIARIVGRNVKERVGGGRFWRSIQCTPLTFKAKEEVDSAS